LLGEFDRVKAMAGRFTDLEIATEDAAWALLGRPSGGPIVAVGVDYVARRPLRHYELVGDERTLTWDLPAARFELAGPDGVEAVDAGPGAFDVGGTYPAAMAEFLTAVGHGLPTSQNIHDGLASVELALAVLEDAA